MCRKFELLKEITPYDGSRYGNDHTFMKSVRSDGFDYWPEDSSLIIEGKIIVPKITRAVAEYDI